MVKPNYASIWPRSAGWLAQNSQRFWWWRGWRFATNIVCHKEQTFNLAIDSWCLITNVVFHVRFLLATNLHGTIDGNGLWQHGAVPYTHSWVGDGSQLMSGRNYIGAIQLRCTPKAGHQGTGAFGIHAVTCVGMNRWVTSFKPVQVHGPFETKGMTYWWTSMNSCCGKGDMRYSRNIIS